MTATVEAPVTIRPRPRRCCPRRPGVLADTWNVMVRELRPVFREPASVLFAMVQPLVFLALFAPLLPKVEDGSALQWFVPGIIAMTALMGASFTGANLTQEIMTGSHERLLVSPLSRSSLLVGRALKEIVPMLMQAAIIVAVVTPFSFDLHLAHVLVGVVILAGFSIGIGALSFALALVVEGPGVAVLDRAADAGLPGAAARRRAAAARGRAGLAPVRLRPQPAEVRRRGRARAVRRELPGRHGGLRRPRPRPRSRRSASGSASGRCAPPAEPAR